MATYDYERVVRVVQGEGVVSKAGVEVGRGYCTLHIVSKFTTVNEMSGEIKIGEDYFKSGQIRMLTGSIALGITHTLILDTREVFRFIARHRNGQTYWVDGSGEPDEPGGV